MSTDPAKPSSPDPLACPRCATPMVAGTAAVRSDLMSFIVAGVSIQHLYFDFRDAGTDKKRLMLESSPSCPAHYCPTCHAFLIDNGKPQYA